MSRPPYHFITPVWGAEYTRLFVDVCLPTLLAPGNIPTLTDVPGSLYQIFTSPEDQRVIEKSVAFRKLTQHIKAEFQPIRARVDSIRNQYFVQSDCYRRGIKISDAAGAAMIFLNADVVVADGGISTLLRLIDSGKRAIMAMGVRLNKQAVEPALLRLSDDPQNCAITVSPRQLARLATDNLHQISRTHLYRSDDEGLNPAGLFWRVGDEGLLMHCFHLHPVVVYPRRKNAPFTTTIDNDYLMEACPDLAEMYVIQDSDEFLACELSDAKRRINAMPRTGNDIDIARWAYFNSNAQHRELIKIPIRMHDGATSSPAWTATLAESDAVVDGVLDLLRTPSALGTEEEIRAYSGTQARPTYVPLHLVTPVWGEEYTRSFLDVTLPSLLAPGNIPAIPNARDSFYTIYATPNARAMIEASPAYALLKEYINVEIRPIRGSLAQKHHASSECYRVAVREAAAAGAAAVFLIPDMILSDGSIQAIVRLLNSGKHAILITGLRVVKSHVVAPLKAACAAGDVIAASPTKLAELALEHLHPITETHLYDSESEYFHPAGFFWRVGNEGFLLRCFHLHPVAIKPRVTEIDFAGTIDDDLMENCGVHLNDTHIVTNSDEILWLEFSDIDSAVPTPLRSGMQGIVEWARYNTTAYHHSLISHTARLHTEKCTPELWQAAQARADAVVAEVLNALKEAPEAPRRWRRGAATSDYPPMWTSYLIVQDIVPVLFTCEHLSVQVFRDLKRYKPETAGAWIIVAASATYLALFWTMRFVGRWSYRTLHFLRRSVHQLRRS